MCPSREAVLGRPRKLGFDLRRSVVKCIFTVRRGTKQILMCVFNCRSPDGQRKYSKIHKKYKLGGFAFVRRQ